MEHERLFEEYILGMMCEGVEKQIRDAYGEGDASARLMAAVSLMAYTDFLGSVLEKDFGMGDYGRRFNAFLRYMGTPYDELIGARKVDAFDVFRSGLVHFFFVKGLCTIAMKNNPGPLLIVGERFGDVVVQKPVGIGIDQAQNGGYFFVVEKYFLDFKTACLRLYAERKGKGETYPLPAPKRPALPSDGSGSAQARASASPLGSSAVYTGDGSPG